MDERQNGNQWYHGKISGEASASILERSSKRDGIFFVRGSLTSKNSFVLCIWANNQPHQFRISTLTDGTFSIDNGQTFRGIDSLIEHYRKSPDGLPCSLSNYMVGNELPSEFRKRTDTLLHQVCYHVFFNLYLITQNNIIKIPLIIYIYPNLSFFCIQIFIIIRLIVKIYIFYSSPLLLRFSNILGF